MHQLQMPNNQVEDNKKKSTKKNNSIHTQTTSKQIKLRREHTNGVSHTECFGASPRSVAQITSHCPTRIISHHVNLISLGNC